MQVKLPWLPGFEPWARVAVPMAGVGRGTFFIPQVGDEVLVVFNQGDVREPYVIGSLWNAIDRPPAALPTDATTKRVIKTPVGHEIELDDAAQTVTITTVTQQRVKIGPGQIELRSLGAGAATATLDGAGRVSIQASASISLKAPQVTIQGGKVDVKSAAATNVNGGAACNIQAVLVKIN